MAILDKLAYGRSWLLTVDADPSGVITAPAGSKAFLNTGGGEWRNTDGATTWTAVGGAPTFPEMAWDPANNAAEDLDSPSVDMLRGAAFPTAGWYDATAASAHLAFGAITSPASMGGKVLTLTRSTAHATWASGYLHPTVAGDFVYYARLSMITSGGSWAGAAAQGSVALTFTHAAGGAVNVLTQRSLGYMIEADQPGNCIQGAYITDNVSYSTEQWDHLSTELSKTLYTDYLVQNVWITRVGNVVSVWAGPVYGTPRQWGSFDFGAAGVGAIGFRVYNPNSPVVVSATVLAFARVTAMPAP